jgi:hypothetical protein
MRVSKLYIVRLIGRLKVLACWFTFQNAGEFLHFVTEHVNGLGDKIIGKDSNCVQDFSI